MTSQNRVIASAATRVAIVATTLSIIGDNTIIQGEGGIPHRMISIEILEVLTDDLKKVTKALLSLLDCEAEDEPGLTD